MSSQSSHKRIPQLEKAVSPEERRAEGKAIRKKVPRSSHGDWSPPADRPDPVDVITEPGHRSVQWLVPIRHGRMSESPFAFYRGAAKIMAADLRRTPQTGLDAQICGDAHLANFGSYRARPIGARCSTSTTSTRRCPALGVGPEAPGDQLRARRTRQRFDDEDHRTATPIGGRLPAGDGEVREARTLDIWYSQLSLEQTSQRSAPTKQDQKRVKKGAKKARSQGQPEGDCRSWPRRSTDATDQERAAVAVPLRDCPEDAPTRCSSQVDDSLRSYRQLAADDRRCSSTGYRWWTSRSRSSGSAVSELAA